MATLATGSASSGWPLGGGEMAGLIRGFDWGMTPLGASSGWTEQLRFVVESMLASPFVVSVVCGAPRTLIYNDAAARLYGDRHPAALGRPIGEALNGGYDSLRAHYDRCFAGETVEMRAMSFGGGGSSPVYDAWLAPLRDGAGAIVLVSLTGVDVSDVARARRESDDALRGFADASSDAFWIRDADTQRIRYVNPAFRSIFAVEGDVTEDAAAQDAWDALILPEDRAAAQARREQARAGSSAGDFRIRRADGALRWIHSVEFPLGVQGGAPSRIGAIGRDVTALREAEARQRQLQGELQHRVRNTLAVMRLIARRTMRSGASVEECAAALDGRINAFARVQSAILRNPTAGVDLHALVADELIHEAARERVTIEGPPVRLQSRAAGTIGLALHELATNALRHGALADAAGRVRISWEWRDGDRLLFTWKESGVAIAAEQPQRRGFGADLLLRTLAYELQAQTHFILEPDGLRYTAEMPLAGRILRASPPRD